MIEEDMLTELKGMVIARGLTELRKRGELGDFIEFAKAESKKKGMDTDGLMKFFDDLSELNVDEEPLEFSWFRVFSAIEDVCPFEVKAFKKDKTILIENEKLSDDQCIDYAKDWVAPINLKSLNKALKPVGVELEFLEAINLPFDADGHSNFIRFEVKKL